MNKNSRNLLIGMFSIILMSIIFVLAQPNISFINITLSTGNYSQNYTTANASVNSSVGIQNITINLYNITSLVNSSTKTFGSFNGWCYQESANTSNQTGVDGNCGLNYSGGYLAVGAWLSPVSNLYDGNWSTGSQNNEPSYGTTDYLYVNYTKPSGATSSSLWEISYEGYNSSSATSFTNNSNYTLPQNCFNQNKLQFNLASYQGSSNFGVLAYCYNGTTWENIFDDETSPSGKIYEEAMWWNVSNPAPTSYNYSYNFTNLPNAKYYLNATAYDTNNLSNSTSTNTIILDTAPPTITLPVYINGTWKRNIDNLTLNISVSDSLSGVSSCVVNVNGGTNQTIPYSNGWCNSSSIYLTGLGDGNRTINVYANDTAGNWGLNNSYVVDIDTTPPTTTANLILNNGTTWTNNTWANQDVNVTLIGVDTGIGVATGYPVYCNDTSNVCSPSTFIGGGVQITTEGTSYIRYYSVDKLGNTEVTKSSTIKIDTTSPSINFTSPTPSNNSYLSQTYIPSNITASDSGSGLKNITINLYNTTSLVSSITNTSSPAFNNFTSLPDGVYYLNSTAYDNVNNVNSTSTRYITLDTKNPAVSYISPTPSNNSYLSQNWINVSLSISETNFANVTYYLYNTTSLVNSTTYNSNITSINWTSLPQGLYYFNTTTYDLAGNSNSTQTYQVTLDTTPPNIYFISPANSSSYNYRGVINFTANETDNIQLANATLYIYNSTGSRINTDNTTSITGTSNQTNWSYTFNNDDVYKWNVQSCDTAGNCAYNSTNYTITIDTTPPNTYLISPTNNTASGTPAVNFTINETDNINLANTTLYIWNSTGSKINTDNTTLITGTSNQTNFTYTFSADGNYYYNAYTCDALDNCAFNSTNYTLSISTTNPAVNLVAPTDNSYLNYSKNILFNFTATNSGGIDTCELYSNFTGTWAINQTFIESGGTSISNNTNKNLTDNLYIWNVWCNTTTGRTSFATTNYTTTIDTTPPQIAFTTGTASNGTNTTNNYIFANVSLTEINLKNITYYLYNSIGSYNITTYTTNITSINWTNLPDGTYHYYVDSYDKANNYNTTETRYITIDTTSPVVTIQQPLAQNYADNNSINLNYTSVDAGVGVQKCWYYVINTNGTIIISTTQLPTCENTTFSLPGGDNNYQLTLYAQDYLGNYNDSQVTFGIRTTSPAVSLNPQDDTHVNYTSNNEFNFTVSTTSSSITNCSLYGNFTGTWALNQTLASVSLSPTVNQFTSLSLPQNLYIWNTQCVDNLGHIGWGLNNETYIVDTTIPNISINSLTPTTGTQTFNFNTTVSDNYLSSTTCKYTIYNSTGGVDGLNNNVAFTCNQQTSATATSYGTFTLNVTATDKAGNSNTTGQSFTLSAASSGGSGGGTTPSSLQYPTVALIQSNETNATFTDLERTIIYAFINNYCEKKVTQPLSVIDYYQLCSLSPLDLSSISDSLNKAGISITQDETLQFYQQYQNNRIYQTFSTSDEVLKFSLIEAIVSNPLTVQPPSLNSAFILPSNGILQYTFLASKPISSCEITSSTPELTCNISTNTTATIYWKVNNTNFFTKTFNGQIAIISGTTIQTTESRYVNIYLNPAINFNYKPFLGIPMYGLFVIGATILVLGLAILSFIRRKK